MVIVMVTMALVAICLVTDSGARMFGPPVTYLVLVTYALFPNSLKEPQAHTG